MRCCISGEVPREPVVSRINGCLYERSLIEKYVAENGRCPKTGEPMQKKDLVVVTTGAPAAPRQVGATSIPGLLNVFQAEWDALMLEQFSLRQQLTSAQQELSQALFQHDAACRVIAKLIKERDALKAAQKERNGEKADDLADDDDEEEPLAIPERVAAEMDQKAEQLKAVRKQREVSRTVATAAEVTKFVQTDSHESHTTASGTVAVNCVAVSDHFNNKLVYSGGADGKCLCYDVNRNAIAGTMVGHTKAIRGVCAASDFVVTCSDDATSRLWRSDDGAFQNSVVLKGHSGSVLSLDILPTHKHLLTVGTDGYMHFSDLHSGLSITSKRAQESAAGLTHVAAHPDGYLAATAAGRKVLIWDLKNMTVDVGLPVDANITSLATCSDGFTIAAGTNSGVVQLWDLRKYERPLPPVKFDDSPTAQASPVTALAFDDSAKYLAVGSHNVKLMSFNSGDCTVTPVTALSNHQGAVTGLGWGGDARWLASGSYDRQVRIYGADGL